MFFFFLKIFKKFFFSQIFFFFFFKGNTQNNQFLEKYLKKTSLSQEQYSSLFAPAFQWICEALGDNAGETIFNQTIQMYEEQCQIYEHNFNSAPNKDAIDCLDLPGLKKSFFLNAIISGFEPIVISQNASLVFYYIKSLEENNYSQDCPKASVLKSLGEKFSICPPLIVMDHAEAVAKLNSGNESVFSENNNKKNVNNKDAKKLKKDKLDFLNDIWKEMETVRVLEDYVEMVEGSFFV